MIFLIGKIETEVLSKNSADLSNVCRTKIRFPVSKVFLLSRDPERGCLFRHKLRVGSRPSENGTADT